MDINKFIMATGCGAITLFAAGFLLFAVLLPNIGLPRPDSECLRPEGILWASILSEVLLAGLLAYIYGKWAGISSFSTGMKTGAVIGAVLGLIIACLFYGATDIFGPRVFAIAAIGWLIRFALAGGVIGWIFGRGAD